MTFNQLDICILQSFCYEYLKKSEFNTTLEIKKTIEKINDAVKNNKKAGPGNIAIYKIIKEKLK